MKTGMEQAVRAEVWKSDAPERMTVDIAGRSNVDRTHVCRRWLKRARVLAIREAAEHVASGSWGRTALDCVEQLRSYATWIDDGEGRSTT